MYYDNKKVFYLKHYGPAILIITLSVALIISGVWWILSKNSNTKKDPAQNIIAEEQTNTVVPNNEQKKEEVEKPKEEEFVLMTNTLEYLHPLDKSEEVIIQDIDKSNRIIISSDNKKVALTLIGIDFSNAVSDINAKLKADLVGKTVKLAFDKESIDKTNTYAYIYIEDNLYNDIALQNGYAKIKKEEKNNSYITELTQSQAFAKQQRAGVWAN